MRFTRNGKFLLSSGKDSLIKLWELSTNRCLIAYTGAGATGKQVCHLPKIITSTLYFKESLSTSPFKVSETSVPSIIPILMRSSQTSAVLAIQASKINHASYLGHKGHTGKNDSG